MKKGRLALWGFFMAFMFSLIAPITAFAATEEYHSDDIAVINRLISQNNLQAALDDPDNWDFAVWDKTASPYRLKELHLSNKGLKNDINIRHTLLEKLDVSGNPIMVLFVPQNKLRELNIEGLNKLRLLSCSYNELTQVTFSKEHKTLDGINMNGNKIKKVDLTPLESITSVSCANGILTEAIAKDNITLRELHINDNQLTTLTLQNLPSLVLVNASKNCLSNLDLSKVHSETDSLLMKLNSQQITAELAGNRNYGYRGQTDLNQPEFTDDNGDVQAGLTWQSGTLAAADNTLTETNFTAQTNLPGGNAVLSGKVQFTFQEAHVITAKAGTGGTITPEWQAVTKENSDHTLTVTANEGYLLSKILVDGQAVPETVTTGSYTLENVSKSHTVEALFEKVPEENGTPHAGGNDNTVSPKTGDSTAPILWVSVLFAASGILLVLSQKRSIVRFKNEK